MHLHVAFVPGMKEFSSLHSHLYNTRAMQHLACVNCLLEVCVAFSCLKFRGVIVESCQEV